MAYVKRRRGRAASRWCAVARHYHFAATAGTVTLSGCGYPSTSILPPAVGQQPDGVGISNAQIPGSIILSPTSIVTLDALHGAPTGTPFIYARLSSPISATAS